MPKTETINIALTDEMKKFVVNQSGDGTLYATPSEYVRDLIRHDSERKEAAELRCSIIEGYQDVVHDRVHEFSGDLLEDLEAHSKRKTQ